jgi:Bacterial regulatory proteins, gntR family
MRGILIIRAAYDRGAQPRSLDPPGARLKIHESCRERQVGNGAVRKALSRLAPEGLVLLEPQKGFQSALVLLRFAQCNARNVR